MAKESSTAEFDTSLFLQFLFSVIFLFVCCFTLMLYVDKALALVVAVFLRFLILPRNVRVGLAGLHFAPLQGRVLFRGFTFQSENLSLHIVDGYITFAFWGFWFKNPRWSRVHEYMVCDTLVGTRCRVRRNLAFVKGTVVAVDVEKRRVSVQLDEQSTNSSGEDDDANEGGTGTDSHPEVSPMFNHSAEAHGSAARSVDNGAGDTPTGRESTPIHQMSQSQRRTTLKEFTTPVAVPNAAAAGHAKGHGANPHVRSEGLGDEVVKAVDANDVYVRSRAGLLQIHLNGLRLCIYNATGKYMDLAKAAAAQSANSTSNYAANSQRDTAGNTSSGNDSARRERRGFSAVEKKAPQPAETSGDFGDKFENAKESVKRAVVQWVRKAANNSQSWDEKDLDAQGMSEPQVAAEVRAARKLQEHNILSTSFAQKFFNFIGCVELEVCSAHVDLGAVAGTHPYFLHLTFQQGEGRVFLTKDGCPALDLYRFVTELTLREVDIRMAQMDSKLSKTQVMRNATLYERARLLFSGVAESYEHLPFESTSSSDLISQYGVVMDGKDKGTVHLVCYKDTANVYAGEAIRRGALPTTGVEVLIDTPVIRYGPWLEYCRTQLWQYFLPPNYLPLQELQFDVGQPRPNAGFEMLVLFLRDTTVQIPFKRRSIVPSPPFGIKDSKRKGTMVATIGAGAQYIQPAFFLLPKEEKQVFQGLFIAKDVTVWANCVLDRETILCHADSVQFFFDRQDDRLWNGRKLFNILTKLSGVELYWYMLYVDYFLDLLNDWQFAASMYHDAPLTTELFNTLNRSVRDFIPNVKRFEIFIEAMASVYLNVNTHNVVYAEDPNDLAHNIMAILKVQSGRFSMVLPSDQYQLSYENEVTRPMEATAKEIKAYISLPASHPLFDQVSAEIPWAYSESFKMNGMFVSQVPNQSIPLSRDNMDTTSGRTKLHNFFTLDLEFTNLRGTLMGTHIKALIQAFQNIFLDNTFTIAPDELFWLLAKLQSHATAGKNKRKEFKQFLEQSQPAGNDMEICCTVRLVDVSATAAAGQAPGAPQVNLSTGLLTFTYVKQFAVTDTGITLSPITMRFPDGRGNFSRNAESNIVVGAITVALAKHFGRMPLKPKVHEAMEVLVAGASVEVSTEQLVTLVEVAQAVARHIAAEDLMMEAEVAEALSAAELLAEKVVRAGPLRNTTDAPRGSTRRRRAGRLGAVQLNTAAVPGGSAVLNGSFYNPNGDEVEMEETDGEGSSHEAVEVQEWRSARRAAAAPQGYQFPADAEGEEEEVRVLVQSQEPVEDGRHNGGDVPILHSYEVDDTHSASGVGRILHGRKRRRLFFAESPASSAQTSDRERGVARRHTFASTVPYDVALGFANFMEECNKADDNSKDYGLFFLVVNVGSVRGVVRIGDDGYAALELPVGLTMAQSTVNDGNSNKRLSAAAKDVGVQLMLHRSSDVALGYLPSLKDDTSLGNYLEVLSLHTSLCLRQYVAYPFDNSLENHRAKQKQFIEDNDYERLIAFPFDNAATHCPPPMQHGSSPTAAAAATAAASPIGKTQSAAAATAEPATLPRPTPQSPVTATVGSAALSGALPAAAPFPAAPRDVSNSPPGGSLGSMPPLPPTARSWQPAVLPLSAPDTFLTPADGDAAGADAAPAAAAVSVGSRPVAGGISAASSDSANTMAHNRNGNREGRSDEDDEHSTLQDYRNLSDTMFPTDKQQLETSNRFETCVSLSSSGSGSGSSPNSTDDFFQDSTSGSSSRRFIENKAFAADRRSSSGSSREATPPPPRNGKSPRPASPLGRRARGRGGRAGAGRGAAQAKAPATPTSVPPHLFYRTFDKAESDDNGICAMDYWPPQRPSGPQRVRDRTGFHAQLPIVGFYLNTERQTRAPRFLSHLKREALQREEDLFAWARCVVDNRERSKHNSTSRHLHLALLDPLTLLVTPEAAVLAATAAQLFLRVHVSLRGHHSELQRAPSTSINVGTASSPRAPQRLLRSHAKKSKARTQQKRWLWEDNIMSVSVPTVEVKLLTRLAVPVENLPDPHQPTDGVYTTSVVVRNLRFIMAQNRPPSGEEVGDASQKVCASLKLDTLAVVTQIEWEPMRREGNVKVKVPSVWYDTERATMAVMFLTQVAGKGKRDLWRGTDGAACNIAMSQLAVHVTRDFADYVHQLLHLAKVVYGDVQKRLQAASQQSLSHSSMLYSESSPLPPGYGGSPRSADWSTGGGGAGAARPAEASRTHKGSTIQGKGLLEAVHVTLIDTERVGQRIVVREGEVSRLEMQKPFCNFVLVTPSLSRDRQVHIQGVGEIDLVKVHVLPSVLHILHPGTPKKAAGVGLATVASPNTATPSTKVLPINVPTFLNSPATVTVVDGTSAFSQGSNDDSGAAGRSHPDNYRPLLFIYDGTFTVHELDLSAKHSDTNYIRLIGKDLTGCAESRMESVASRECVQTEALTEAISEGLKARLRYKANRARERAKRSRYPAPPESTEQLHLHSTASFFAHQVQVHYVAECMMEPIVHEVGVRNKGAAASPTAPAASQSIQSNKILSADITSITLVAQFTSQYNVRGDQTNLHMIVRNVVVDSPFCLRAAEMLHPQVHALVSAWRDAVKAVTKSMRRGSGGLSNNKSAITSVSRRSFSFADKDRRRAPRSSAVALQVQATSITGYVGLPQGIVQKFLLPQISCFTKSSSGGRVDLKLHLHPFTITAHNAPQENYQVVLPHVYVLYGHDNIKMLCSVTMGTVAITITPLFINHTLLTYEKITNDLLVVVASPATAEDGAGSPVSPQPTGGGHDSDAPLRRETSSRYASSNGTAHDEVSQDTHTGAASARGGPRATRGKDAGGFRAQTGAQGNTPTNNAASARSPTREGRGSSEERLGDHREGMLPPATPRRRRQSFLFLLQGVRLSYLTSMTTLRFTMRNLNATADTTEGDSRHTLRWVVHVTDAQAALVDRDDHDQMIATYRNLTGAQRTSTATAADLAQVEHAVFGSGRSSESASVMKAVHPLGGFLWGSVGLSLTLSSGKVDENRFIDALQESTSFSNYSEELQKALIESFTNSTSKWELYVYEPLVILRVGLDSLIKQCVRETEEDIREMKRLSHEDTITATLQLHRYKRFQRFQMEKKRIDGLLRRAQKERQRQLRTMTERVVHDVRQRRGGVYVEGSEHGDGVLDFFSTVKSHKVTATVTNVMVVVPFGDAPYRRILEELPDTFSCGKTDRHIHSASCLNRRQFIPSYALKAKMNTVSFICNVEVVKRLVPILVADPRANRDLTDSVYATGGSANQGYSTTVLFHGRLLALDSHVFFTDGSLLKGETTLCDVLRNTCILGGQGLLTSYASDEHERSLNSFAITSIEAPLRIERRANAMTVGVVVDVSEPKGRISSLFMGILRELSLEQPSTKLEAHVRSSRRRRAGQSGPASAARPRSPAGGSAGRVLYSEEVQPAVRKETISLHLDITGRLEASELAVYCYSNPERFSTTPTAAVSGGGGGGGGPLGNGSGASPAGGVGGGAGRRAGFGADAGGGLRGTKLSSARRRVGFETATSPTRHSRWRVAKEAPPEPTQPGLAVDTRDRYLIMSIPLPGVTVRADVHRGRREGADDIAVVRAELRAGTVELSPYITALAQEVEMCTTLYHQHRLEHSKKIFSFVQEMEAEVPQLGVPLHCALVEVLLPMPRAYATVLAKEEMNSVVRLRRSASRGRPLAESTHLAESDDSACEVPVQIKRRARGLTAVHLTISDFRLTFTTEPAASTQFTVYLDSGGTIDFIFKHFVRSDVVKPFVNKFPDISLVVTLRRLRAECQTKLEVKSLEMFLPEAEITVSRRSGHIGLVDSIAVYLPFNVEGTEPNLTLRLQHISQLFLVIDMWSFTTSETLRSIKHLFARGAAGDDIARRMVKTQLGKQVAKGNHALREKQTEAVDRRTIVFVGLSHALCFCDIGAGSAHNFTIGEAYIAAESTARASGCSVDLLMGRVMNTSIRSEGVLSGGMIIGDVCAKGFVIQNAEDAEVFERTPEQRTFREALLVRQVHVNFKERQLKDVFECRVGDFRGSSMDGIGEEDYTTTDLDVSLHRGTLGVTPSTVPAVLSFVRNISSIVAEQRRISAVKLREKTLYLQPSDNVFAPMPSLVVEPQFSAGAAKPRLERPSWADPESSSRRDSASDGSQSSTATQAARGCIRYFGNRLLRVPCGQLRIGVDDTTVLLGAVSSGEATAGCVVVSFAKGRLSFAECPCDDYEAAKKVLVIETHNVELFRPGTPRVVVMGFQGVNHFEFYTRQVLGSPEVGFTLTLRQTNPWTGNPRFRDFEEMIHLIKSFTDKKNADVIKQFGRVEQTTIFEMDMASAALRRDSGLLGMGGGVAESDSATSRRGSTAATPATEDITAVVETDERKLKALRSSKFSPQLRFGGDVSVNTEVILNWLGVTEKMLPHVVHMALCDKLENLLNSLAMLASERVRRRTPKEVTTTNLPSPPAPKPADARRLDYQ